MTQEQAIDLITAELERARLLHPQWPTDCVHAAAIVCEEAGELAQAALDHTYSGQSSAGIRREAVHTAATAMRLLMGG